MKTLLIINSGGTYEDSTNSNLVIRTEIEFTNPKEIIEDFINVLKVCVGDHNDNLHRKQRKSLSRYFNYLFTVPNHEFHEWELFDINGYQFNWTNFIPDKVIQVDGMINYLEDYDLEDSIESLDITLTERGLAECEL